MAMKKRGGGKLKRSETVTVRLDPKLRYAGELAARQQRRTLSSYIEWAVEQAVRGTTAFAESGSKEPESVYALMQRIWDVHEADRLRKLAEHGPSLLNYEEERLLKIIEEWKQSIASFKESDKPTVYKFIREHFERFVAVGQGDADVSSLPPWKPKGGQRPSSTRRSKR